jgi:hypothetical protein
MPTYLGAEGVGCGSLKVRWDGGCLQESLLNEGLASGLGEVWTVEKGNDESLLGDAIGWLMLTPYKGELCLIICFQRFVARLLFVSQEFVKTGELEHCGYASKESTIKSFHVPNCPFHVVDDCEGEMRTVGWAMDSIIRSWRSIC